MYLKKSAVGLYSFWNSVVAEMVVSHSLKSLAIMETQENLPSYI